MPDTYSDPLRLRVHKALSALFADITIANGYKTDLGEDSVFRGRNQFGASDPVTMVSILESPEFEFTEMAGDGGASFSDWKLLIWGTVQDDKRNPTDPAHVLMADVKRCIALEKRERRRGRNLLGSHEIDDIAVGAGVVRPPDETSPKAYFWLPLTIRITEDIADPYN